MIRNEQVKDKMPTDFQSRVLDRSSTVTIFEFIPPEIHTSEESLMASASALTRTLKGFHGDVHGVYIPEIVDETARGIDIRRPERVGAKLFASYVKNECKDQFQLDSLITHPFAHTPTQDTQDWLKSTHNDLDIQNIVVVGPSTRHSRLPGMSVTQALSYMSLLNKQAYNFFPGAIAIASRRASGNDDEPMRMVRKIRAGAKYFTTQIFYDTATMIDLLESYSSTCETHSIEPVRVFLSVAPIASRHTLKVISALGASPPDNMIDSIFAQDGSTGNRSIKMIETMLKQIFDHCHNNNLNIPLGLCIGHVTEGNIRLAYELLHRLPPLVRQYE